MTDLHRSLSKNLKKERSRMGISQAKLAELANVSVGFVGEIEACNRFPSPEILEKLANAVGKAPYQLLMTEKQVQEHEKLENMNELAQKLMEEMKRMMGK